MFPYKDENETRHTPYITLAIIALNVLVWLFIQGAVMAGPVAPQDNKGSIDGRVTTPGGVEGIPDVQVTLQGPTPVAGSALSGLYTPNSALTPAMRGQIDTLIASAPPGTTPEVIANAAVRMEARLLGLPIPATPGAAVQPTVRTDGDGHFSFKNLAPGRYQIRAQRDGYFGLSSSAIPTVAVVAVEQQTSRTALVLVKGAMVSGRVLDPDGKPAPGLQVNAYRLGYQNTRALLQFVSSQTTGGQGEYQLPWLRPDKYWISVTPVRTGSASGLQDTYARTFYPSAIDARTAQPLSVNAGADMPGVDIRIRAEAIGRISGRVVSPFVSSNGQPNINSLFYLIATDSNVLTDDGILSFSNLTPNAAGGRFELRGVMPGTYDVVATATDGSSPDSGKLTWGRTRVNVAESGARDVTINLHAGIEVKAKVVLDAGPPPFTMAAPPQRGISLDSVGIVDGATLTRQPPPSALVPTPAIRLQLRSAENASTPFEGASNQGTSYDPAGVFVFPAVVEGRYTFLVTGLPPNAYIEDVLLGGASVFDNGFEVNGQSNQLEVRVNSNGLKIQGTVRDARRDVVAAATVVLVPRQSRRQNTALYKVTSSRSTGEFTFTGVAPGEYKLFAWEAVPNNANDSWMNAEFIQEFESRGQSIAVSSTATADVDLRLIPK